ncbi:MAG: arylesterase [Neomegalonema sp.]|nr:arylesterase [Neomegalonema sp.]
MFRSTPGCSMLRLSSIAAIASGAAFGASRVAFKHFTAALALSVALLSGFAEAEPTSGAADKKGETIRVVAFGDSLTAGYGLPVPDGFAPQLQRWLRANGAPDVIVINAGVSGDTTSDGLARLDWSIGPDADAVILELGANDALRGVDPAVARANLDKMLARLKERGLPVLLAGMKSPRNWGDEYVEAFEPIYKDLATKYGAMLYPFFLDGLVGQTALFQRDGLHPNADGVKKLVETIGPSVLKLIEQARAKK